MNRRKHKRILTKFYRRNLKMHDTYTLGYINMMKKWLKSSERNIIDHERNVYFRRNRWRLLVE